MFETSPALLDSGASWALIFAHPGHELRAHHLLERARPIVSVLTDGSGSIGASRLDQTRQLLADAGARPSAVFGVMSDREAYAALMTLKAEPFLVARDRLAWLLRDESPVAVVVDAAEGFNPVHDVCHWIGCAAASEARRLGASVSLFELDLVAHPDGEGKGVRIALDEHAFERKLQAAARYHLLAGEIDAALGQFGRDAFRVEFMRHVVDASLPPRSWVPYYEEVGEERVRAGRYRSVLRYADHVKPVIDALLEPRRFAADAEAVRPLNQ
jgi:hypothetical protein